MSVQSPVTFIAEGNHLKSILFGIAIGMMVPGCLLPALSALLVGDSRELSCSNRRCYGLVRPAAPNVLDDPCTPPASGLAAVASPVAVSVVLFRHSTVGTVLRTICVPTCLALRMVSIGAPLVFGKFFQWLNRTAFRASLHVSHGVDLQRKTHSLRLLHKSPNHAVAPQVGMKSVTDMRLSSNYLHGLATSV